MKIKSFFVLIFLVFFLACENDPTSVGSGLLEDQFPEDKLEQGTLENLTQFTTYSYTVEDTINNSELSSILLGDFNSITAKSILRFELGLSNELLDKIKNNTAFVEKVEFNLIPSYKIGDFVGSFDLMGYSINNIFDFSDLNWESQDTLNIDYSKNIVSNLTKTDTSFSFLLDNDFVNIWIEDEVQGRSGNDRLNRGFILEASTTSESLISFNDHQLSSSIPEITYYFKNDTGSVDTVKSKPVIDTYLLKGEAPVEIQNRITLNAGFQIDGLLDYDWNQLPENIAVTKCEIELFYDKDNSVFGIPAADTIFTTLVEGEDNSVVTESGTVSGIFRNDSSYTGDISSSVQYILSNKENYALNLSIKDVLKRADKIYFYNENSINPPKLKIWYTKLQN